MVIQDSEPQMDTVVPSHYQCLLCLITAQPSIFRRKSITCKWNATWVMTQFREFLNKQQPLSCYWLQRGRDILNCIPITFRGHITLPFTGATETLLLLPSRERSRKKGIALYLQRWGLGFFLEKKAFLFPFIFLRKYNDSGHFYAEIY